MGLRRWFYTVPLRLRSVFQRTEVERELDEELTDHLERGLAALTAAGWSPEEARQAVASRLRLDRVKEECREAWHVRFLDQLLQDLRYAARGLHRSPAFTTVAVLSLALGIGANTALFSMLDAVLLRLLPVREPQRLVQLWWTASGGFPQRYVDDIEGSGCSDHHPQCPVFSLADFERLRARNTSFTDTMAYADNEPNLNLAYRGKAQDALVQVVSGNYFQVLGIRPALGRLLQPIDDTPNAPQTAVISDSFWRSRLAGDPGVLGQTLMINGTPTRIIGVAPPGFFGLRPGTLPVLWVPLHVEMAQDLRVNAEDMRSTRVWWLGIVGRLKPGKTVAQARAELRVLFAGGLVADRPPRPGDPLPQLGAAPVGQGLSTLRDLLETPLFLLAAMVAVLLLIACANVAGLLLARASVRQPEILIRLSLGARRLRILRQLTTESILLALLGGALGLLVARLAQSGLTKLLTSGPDPVTVEPHLDGRVLLFTLAVAMGCGLLFGMAPAFRAGRQQLRTSSRAAASPAARFRSGKVLVAGQVALALLLLISASLFGRTLLALLHVDLGFERRQLVVFRLQPGLNGYAGDRLVAYYEELERRLAALPEVEAAGFSEIGPIASGQSVGRASVPGRIAPEKASTFYRHRVDPGYFRTIGLPAEQGRVLNASDRAKTAPVVVVNERLVRDFFGRENPLGRRFNPGDREYTIVGVVRDMKYHDLRLEPPPTAYFSYLQVMQVPTFMHFAVRCRGDLGSAMRAVQRVVHDLDPNVPLSHLRSEVDMVDEALFIERTFASLSLAFAAVALLLACVGLYGTIAYVVAQRTHEIGVCMALGARRTVILGGVLREIALVVLCGIAIGLPLTWWVVRLLASQLFGLSAHDPWSLGLAVAALAAATLAAGWVPARAAARVDPMVALRHD